MKWEYLQYTIEDKEIILNAYNRKLCDLPDDVETIKKWIASQPHLPKILENEQIEKFLLLNKISIEKTKQKIDMYFSIQKYFPEIYKEYGPLSEVLPACGKEYHWNVLPKLDKNKNRLLFFNLVNNNSDNFNIYAVFGYILCISEIRLMYDFCHSDVICYDFKNMVFGHLVKATPTALKQMITILEGVFSMKIKGLYMIHTSPIVEKFIALLKPLLKPKMAARIKTFRTLEDLYKEIPKELMPRDYGGNQPSTSELSEKWNAKIQEHKDWFEKLRNNPVDESLRIGKPLNDDFLGYHGNFKKLDLD